MAGAGLERASSAVVKDFTFESGYEDFPPGLLLLAPDYGTPDLMFVRVKPGDLQEVVQYMQETWSSIISDEDFHFSFLQQDMEAAYRDELRWRRLITWAAVGAVFISALGCLCAHRSRCGSPHQGDRHPQGPRCQRLWSHHTDNPRVCLPCPDWLAGGVAAVVVVDARLAERLCLPH